MQIKSTGAGDTGAATVSTRTTDDDEGTGVMASIRRFFAELFGDEDEQTGHYAEAVRRGGAVLTVEVEESRVELARSALTEAAPSTSRSRCRAGAARAGRVTTSLPRRTLASSADSERENVVPVVQEELEVGKRQVRGGAVRVVSRVVSQPVSESVELRREEATIERRPVDRPATEADLASMQERTIEVTEMAERPVVSKSARVVEEVLVGKQVSSETQVVEDTVRRTEVEVERVGGDGSSDGARSGGGREQVGATQVTPAGAMGSSAASGASGSMMRMAMGGAATSNRRDFADLDDEFRQHYQTNFASSGARYEDFQPAYRGGYEMRGDSRFADTDWDTAEPELRRRWESDNPGSAWERVKAAFRRGWDRATS